MNLIEDADNIEDDLKDNLNDYCRSIENREVITKNKYVLDDKTYELTKARAYLNSLLLPILPKELQTEQFLFLSRGSSSDREEYQQRVIDRLYELSYHRDDITDIVYKMKLALNRYNLTFNFRLSIDISIYDFVKMVRMDKRMKEILVGQNFTESMSAHEVTETKEKLAEEIEEFILENKIDPFYTFLGAEAAMRRAQFFDITVGVGLRPRNTEIYPHIVKESWLNGIRSKNSFWIENDSARYALILQKLHVSDTGSFKKHATMLAQPNYLNDNPDYCCDTKHFFKEDITEDNYQHFIDAYIQRSDGHYLLTKDNIENFIGETVNIRQPLTCNSTDGICHYCVGEKIYYDNLESYHGGVRNLGDIITKALIAPKVQGYLSAKHNAIAKLLALGITPYDGNVEYSEVFDIKFLNTLMFHKHLNIESVEFLEPHVYRKNGKQIAGSKYIIVTIDGNDIIFEADTEFWTLEDNIDQHKILDNTDVHIRIANEPVASDYHDLDTIFNSNGGNFSRTLEMMKHVMSNERIIVPYILMRNIIRNPKNDSKRPDFSKDKRPRMKLLNMPLAIRRFEELGVKLSIGWFKERLSDISDYSSETSKPSKFDILFESRRKEK